MLSQLEEQSPSYVRSGTEGKDPAEARPSVSSPLHLRSYKGVPPTENLAGNGAIQLHITIPGQMQSCIEIMPPEAPFTPRTISALESDAMRSSDLLLVSDEDLKSTSILDALRRISVSTFDVAETPTLRVRQFFKYIRPQMTEEESAAALESMKRKLGLSGDRQIVGQGGIKSLLQRAGIKNPDSSKSSSQSKLGSKDASGITSSPSQNPATSAVPVPPRDLQISVTIQETPEEREHRLGNATADRRSARGDDGETEDFFEPTEQDAQIAIETVRKAGKSPNASSAKPNPGPVTKEVIRLRIQIPSPYSRAKEIDAYHSVTVETAVMAPIVRSTETKVTQEIKEVGDAKIESTQVEEQVDFEAVTEKMKRTYVSKGHSLMESKQGERTVAPDKILTFEPLHPPLTVEACFHIREPLTALYGFIDSLLEASMKAALEHGDIIEGEDLASQGSAFDDYSFYLFATPPYRRLDLAKDNKRTPEVAGRIKSVPDSATLLDVGVNRPLRLFVTWLKRPMSSALDDELGRKSTSERAAALLRPDVRSILQYHYV